jgi:hypothetical protein
MYNIGGRTILGDLEFGELYCTGVSRRVRSRVGDGPVLMAMRFVRMVMERFDKLIRVDMSSKSCHFQLFKGWVVLGKEVGSQEGTREALWDPAK